MAELDLDARDELLSLQEAADRLKVHYMTAYRWVRRGELPAFKAGGRLRVRRGELERFVSDRCVEVALPSDDPGRTDWPAHVERFHRLLLEGEGVEAAAMVRKVVTDGAAAGDVYVRLVAPALHRVGEDWAARRITVAEEHRATEICLAVMARLGTSFRRRGPGRGVAVTTTPPGEAHGLAPAMAADFLRAGGYDVHHLGPDVPLDDLHLFLQVVPADVVCVSATMPLTPGVAEGLVRAAGEATLVIGGQGADRDVVERAGAFSVPRLRDLMGVLDEVRSRDAHAEAVGAAAVREGSLSGP